MPDFQPSDLVNYAVSRDLENLEAAWAALMDTQLQNRIAQTQEKIGKYLAPVGEE